MRLKKLALRPVRLGALVMTDIVQVGLTYKADEQLRELHKDTPYFREEADVYRCGVAVALALKVDITGDMMSKQSLKNKFRTIRDKEIDDGSSIRLDRLDTADGRLARLISAHRPEWSEQPYRYSQYLAVIGINYLHGRLIDKGMTLVEAFDELRARKG